VRIGTKLFACLGLFAVAILALAASLQVTSHDSRGALDTLLADRVLPLRDLKIVADKYVVDIVDASHKARNGNMSMADERV
jgi:methyl-accepting chemotaxis protein